MRSGSKQGAMGPRPLADREVTLILPAGARGKLFLSRSERLESASSTQARASSMITAGIISTLAESRRKVPPQPKSGMARKVARDRARRKTAGGEEAWGAGGNAAPGP